MNRLGSLVFAIVTLGVAAPAFPALAAPADVFQHIVEQRLARMIANARAMKATPRPDAGPGYIAVGEDGAVSARPDDGSDFFVAASEAALAARVEDMRARLHGDTAVVVYRVELSLRFNGETCLKPFRVTEVFQRTRRGWRSIAEQQTAIPGRPTYVARIDPRRLDDYAGAYRLLPSVAYSFTRKGERLFWGDTELFPESDSTFATADAADYRLLFLRDPDGRVTGVRIRELSGVEYTATRVEDGPG